ncbi:MAG: hypothetical protein WA919_24200 [Coleofasciculaceae cyanobacterium]
MKVTAFDSKIIKTIEPQKLRDYLQAHGWYKDRPFLNNATVWLKQDSERGEFEILLPLKQDVRDYAPRIREAIETLEIVENRSQVDILSELMTTANNITIQGVVMQVHTPNADQLSGQITLLGVVGEKLHKIKTELFDQGYILAIKAYQERLPISCTGNLIKENNIFILKNPRDFTLDTTWQN